MRAYSISEAIAFLVREYGEEHMPTSEETLRRAIRTKKLVVQEEGDPGRKGYRILEKDLREYARQRLERAQERRQKSQTKPLLAADAVQGTGEGQKPLLPFPELFSRYMEGTLSSDLYYRELFHERMRWEKVMHEKQLMLAKLNEQVVALQSDIQSCQSAIDAYSDGISKFKG